MTLRDVHIILVSLAVACLIGLAISHDPREQPDGSINEVSP